MSRMIKYWNDLSSPVFATVTVPGHVHCGGSHELWDVVAVRNKRGVSVWATSDQRGEHIMKMQWTMQDGLTAVPGYFFGEDGDGPFRSAMARVAERTLRESIRRDLAVEEIIG